MLVPRKKTVAFEAALQRFLIPDLPLADDTLRYLRRADSTRWYSNFGPLVCEFEERLRSELSASDPSPRAGDIHLTSVVTCTHALEIGLRLTDIGPGKRVLVPALTFPASALAVQHTGAEVLLADVDPADWSLTPTIARAIASRVQIDAVMPVAVFGVPLPVPAWDEFTSETDIPLVIDAAAALETQVVPARGLVAYSLHATKPFGIGEGGVLVGRSSDLICKGRQYSNFGLIDRISCMEGTNAKMSEYHAAVGLAQLDRWNEIKRKRRDLLGLYNRHLQPLLDDVSLHPAIDEAVVSLLMLLLEAPVAESVMAEGKLHGIAMHRTYLPPLYDHPFFATLNLATTDGMILSRDVEAIERQACMVNCERLQRRLLGVPFHAFMCEEDVATVVHHLRSALGRLS
ncbi:MAG: DegT/DnrJ/EryC1/StrS family aminotransferase [Steroidobacteraceae bacterium]